MELVIAEDDPRADDVRAVLDAHLTFAEATTPEGHVFALALDGLLDPSVTFFAARQEGRVLGIGAIKRLGDGHMELKSMHTAASARGQGVGGRMVDHLLGVARQEDARRVSLETGTNEAFGPARALYEWAGFVPCVPFGAYTANPFSTCMTLDLQPPDAVRIRRATPDDARAAADVWLRSRKDSIPAIPAPVHDDDDVRRWFAEVVLPTRETWIAEEGADTLAVLVLQDGWLDQLHVEPGRTGQGLGSRLVDLAKGRGHAGLDLWVFQSNVDAIRFYERHGFVEVDRTDGDNEEGAPDLRLRWSARPVLGVTPHR